MNRTAWPLLLMLGLGVAHADVLSWTTAGPETGAISVVQFDPTNPQIAWVATQVGLFRSDDAGLTWSFAGSGIIGRLVSALAINPVSPSTVYAGSPLGTIYKTTDRGATWVSSGTGLFAGGAPITAMLIDPLTPSTLYAATESRAVYPSLGVQKSINDGQSWTDSGANGLGTKNVYALAIDRQNPATVYAGGLFDNSGRPLFKSTNGGASWVSISSGLSGGTVDAIAVDPLVSQTILIAEPFGVRKSTTGGTSWSSIDTGLPSGAFGPTAVVHEPNSSSNIWLASLSDIYRTTNGGASWTAAKIANKRVNALDVSSDRVVIAGTADAGLYRRTAGATSWIPSNSGLLASQILSMTTDATSPGLVYAATAATGIFKSTDHGRSWKLLTDKFLLSNVNAMAIDPKSSSTLYAALGSFYKSTDRGMTWSLLTIFPDSYAIAVDPLVTDVLYVGTGNGVFRSTNGGQAFSSASAGLPSEDVIALTIDPVNTSTVYAAVRAQGLYKSTDGGTNWTKKSSGMTDPDVISMAIDPMQPAVLYAATDGGGVFKSTDGAQTWSAANSGLTTNLMRSVALSPSDPGTVYVGTTTRGVFQSTDAGATWTLLGGVSPAPNIATLAVEPGGDAVHAGSTSGGVWSFQFRAFDPTLRITFPMEGAEIGNRAMLVVTIQDFTLDCSTTGPSGQNRGHWRIEVDGVLDSTGCTPAMQLAKTYALGSHQITVSLRNPDGSTLSPPVEQIVNVVIVDQPPRRRAVRR